MSTTIPNSPGILDSTGIAIVEKLDDIAEALGGGGGGSSMPNPPEWDQTNAYSAGEYVLKDDVIYRARYDISANTAWSAGNWTEVTDKFAEFFQNKPGKITSLPNKSEIFNDYTYNTATGQYSHAEGYDSHAYGSYSHAEGQSNAGVAGNTAFGQYAHAEGHSTAYANYSHSEGYSAVGNSSDSSMGRYAHAEGYTTVTGQYAHGEGYYGQALGKSSHVEGEGSSYAFGIGSHAEGYRTFSGRDQAVGSTVYNYTHAEGKQTYAIGEGSHAEGNGSKAYGNYSHAQGTNSMARGVNSHAGGTASETGASAPGSIAQGIYAQTTNIGEAAFGKCNSSDNTSGHETMFSVGNGTSASARSNLFELKADGTGYLNNEQLLALNPPTTDGTYTLQVTVTNGVPVFSWV